MSRRILRNAIGADSYSRKGAAMKALIMWTLLIALMSASLSVSGCYSCAVSLGECTAKYKTCQSAARDFETGSTLSVRNDLGPISVSGGNVTGCQIKGRMYVHAPTKRQAKEIAEQVRLAAERTDGTLTVTVEKPSLDDKCAVWTDLEIVVPSRAHVNCQTEFGRIRLAEIEGDVRAVTEFGSITCDEVASGNIAAKSEFGSIRVRCADECPADLVADVRTEFGKIRFDAPEAFGGDFDIGTEFGSTSAKLSTASRDRWKRHRKAATTGSGSGRLFLCTEFGSVRLK
jgi:hypothetical protein